MLLFFERCNQYTPSACLEPPRGGPLRRATAVPGRLPGIPSNSVFDGTEERAIMPQQANIVLTDGKATPVAHTFVPQGVQKEGKTLVGRWLERALTAKIGWWDITEQHSVPNGNGVEKMRFVLRTPLLETPVSSGTPSGYVAPEKVAYVPWAEIIYHMPERATEDQLDDLAQMVGEFADSAFVKDKVAKRDATFG